MSRSSDSALRDINIELRLRSYLGTLAIIALAGTILLIMVGSYVRVSGNGLGCPDWPLCYGQAVPPLELSAWVEFTHRLIGGLVGFLIGAVCLLILRDVDRTTKSRISALALGSLLIVQVALGGLHVLNELPRWTGLIHTGVAMAIAGLIAYLVTETQPKLKDIANNRELVGGRAPKVAMISAAATYILILTGSLVTRTGSSLVCPAFPHCGVSPIPENLQSYVIIQMIHRASAFTVAAALTVSIWYLLKSGSSTTLISRLAIALGVLLLAQFGLGIGNVLLALPMWTRILHLGTAAMILVLAVIVAFSLRQPQGQLT